MTWSGWPQNSRAIRAESTVGDDESLLKWLILAYPDRVVRRRGSEETGVMVGGRGVRLGRDSIVREGELFLALDPRRRAPAGHARAPGQHRQHCRAGVAGRAGARVARGASVRRYSTPLASGSSG